MPDLSSALSSLEVTITPTMICIAGFVAYVLQFIKACIGGWQKLTAEIQKPLWPLMGIVLCSLAFGLAHVENYLVAGTILGLAAGGGYDAFRGTTALIKSPAEPPKPTS